MIHLINTAIHVYVWRGNTQLIHILIHTSTHYTHTAFSVNQWKWPTILQFVINTLPTLFSFDALICWTGLVMTWNFTDIYIQNAVLLGSWCLHKSKCLISSTFPVSISALTVAVLSTSTHHCATDTEASVWQSAQRGRATMAFPWEQTSKGISTLWYMFVCVCACLCVINS